MPDRKSILPTFFAVMLIFQTLGCGMSGSNSNRVLQSIAVTPATADAQSSANGQVQFTATGTFSKAPSPSLVTFVAPYSGGWQVSDSTVATLLATGTGTATVRCAPGASGVVTITAMASANAAMGTQATGVATVGKASLTCP